MSYTWKEMLEDFRSLGGTADNIKQGTGPRGRGLFPIDTSKPIRLHVPKNLLVPVEDVEFVDGKLKIKATSKLGEPEREFVEKYEETFSWGGEGRSDCASFIAGMETLSLKLDPQSFINAKVAKALSGVRDPVAQRFLESRVYECDNLTVLAPLMELVNHDESAGHRDVTDGMSIEGRFSDEVLDRYVPMDPFGMFMSYGFASAERFAFSFPIVREGAHRLVVRRDVNFNTRLGAFPVPEFRIENGNVTLSCMVLGNKRSPRIPKSIFVTVLREAGWTNPEEEFEFIQHQNRMLFLEFLGALETEQGRFVELLRRVFHLQLQAMSHCFGIREL